MDSDGTVAKLRGIWSKLPASPEVLKGGWPGLYMQSRCDTVVGSVNWLKQGGAKAICSAITNPEPQRCSPEGGIRQVPRVLKHRPPRSPGQFSKPLVMIVKLIAATGVDVEKRATKVRRSR